MTARRPVAATLLAGLVLAACGSSSPTAEAPSEVPAAEAPTDEGAEPTAAPADEQTNEQPDEQTGELPPTTTLADAVSAPATDEPADSAPVPTGDVSAEPTTTVTTTTSVPPGSESQPETAIADACSIDGSPTELEVADGPLPELAVVAASAASPLPDLAVRRINCGGGWVNLRNEIPADRPLLIWFWAPH